MQIRGKLTQYDQLNGDIKDVAPEMVHHLQRYGNIDFPEAKFTIFKNKVMANLSELYSPDHFEETFSAAEINLEIIRLTKPEAAWRESGKSEILAGNIVSSGLFSFLKGGMPSPNQIWIFCVCVYVTLEAVLQFLFPPIVANILKYLSLGRNVVKLTRRVRNYRRQRRANREVEQANEQPNALSLVQRWRSAELAGAAEVNVLNAPMQKYYTNQIHICDRNYRVEGRINGKNITCLLDTGAYMSLMGFDTAKLFDITATKNPEIPGVFGVGNELVPAVGQSEIRFEIAGCHLKSDLLLVKNDIQKDYDMIIGRNTLVFRLRNWAIA